MPKLLDPPAGSAIKETKFTEVVPAPDSAPNGERSYDAFEYMDKMKPEDWTNHYAVLYRTEPPIMRGAGEKGQITQFTDFFDLRQIQKDFGGGIFRILIKKNRERVADSKHAVAGAPRDLMRGEIREFDPSAPGGVPTDATAPSPSSVVTQAMNMVSNPTVQNAQVEVMKNASNAALDMLRANAPKQLDVKELLELARSLNGEQKSFLETPLGAVLIAAASALVTTLVNRMTAPPADPLDQIIKMGEVMSKFGGGSSSSDWKAALVDAAPKLAVAVKDGLHELRLGAEAQQRAALPAAPIIVQPNPVAPPVPASGNVVEMPRPQPPLPGAVAPVQMEVPVQFIWQKIFEMLQDGESTGEEIGEFLDQLAPGFIAEMKAFSIDQVTQYVQGNPAIAQIAQHPRFRQCLTELLAWANQPPDAPNKGA